MNNTPNANRKHIAIYGKTNSGKSSLLNAIVGQDISLVSPIKGTTTDPVSKAMELIPFGPVLFIDTAGLDDNGELGELRIKRSLKTLQKTDFAIYVVDINDICEENYKETVNNFKKYKIPHMVVVNKIDEADENLINSVKEKFKDAVFVSAKEEKNIIELKEELIKRLQNEEEDETLIGDIVPYNGKVIMVVPIDSEAPKGRLILPQVQLIRDCLDHGIKSYVVRDTELESALQDIKDVDLVITDSQAFKKVSQIVPEDIKLTSFSILFAKQKGDLKAFMEGISKIKELDENSKILITESCTHNASHEDIGRVKIPKLLNKHVGKELNYEFKMGHDFPEDIEKYDLVIHCGACMVNKKTVQTRIDMCEEKNVKIVNYGMILAYLTGILPRSLKVFDI
ncbi:MULTISPECIES: [FeFe] hydrogenase H-cluster maturation GTPase HydF [Clostridium]|uniref:GTPase Era n=2 Tax=Clostridium TaxID=1485 RepID=A0A151AKU2_9CLOT|nr:MULTISPECIES: [FeFe] hydrogenase H-cluster maturation GTPase HydF [Clostridium]KYH28205.1 GTPase Era [Clostridium colicanis DSM 13634]MBE6044279.1 [FeFe] hydrogenase H-cluster maturation GTPase HydF [Clostridium thermopalmarium]PRR76590.1 GTPase Era [Clostridium thermopalmarium DSM 5974]PVZ28297.1 iron-only hydrogenase maturation protein HydF [Clostridium thermopalmarium DSM 5974]